MRNPSVNAGLLRLSEQGDSRFKMGGPGGSRSPDVGRPFWPRPTQAGIPVPLSPRVTHFPAASIGSFSWEQEAIRGCRFKIQEGRHGSRGLSIMSSAWPSTLLGPLLPRELGAGSRAPRAAERSSQTLDGAPAPRLTLAGLAEGKRAAFSSSLSYYGNIKNSALHPTGYHGRDKRW